LGDAAQLWNRFIKGFSTDKPDIHTEWSYNSQTFAEDHISKEALHRLNDLLTQENKTINDIEQLTNLGPRNNPAPMSGRISSVLCPRGAQKVPKGQNAGACTAEV
jgi:hypothetical protein